MTKKLEPHERKRAPKGAEYVQSPVSQIPKWADTLLVALAGKWGINKARALARVIWRQAKAEKLTQGKEPDL